MRKKYATLAAVALASLFAPLSVPVAVHADEIVLAEASGSGCWAQKVTGPGTHIHSKNWDWVHLECGKIQGAKYARAKIVCDKYPDRYTSWLVDNEKGDSGGCPFGSGAITIEYTKEI